ncbi:MAG: hypothetical protein JRJ15_04535, partial [Deltaproteobacteria bacterium]|nr:hypothetical protein [Deltaproteobacteria bacterium]
MPEIKYKALKAYLKKLKEGREANGFAPVYLIYGEELLYKTAFEMLLNALIPGPERSLNYESIEGANENIHEALQRINTYSLLPDTKVVAICDAKIFYSKQNEGMLLEKAKEALEANNIGKAATYFLSLLGRMNLTYDDVQKPERHKTLKLDADRFGDSEWLDQIVAYCVEKNRPIPGGEDIAGTLAGAIENGFPKNNYLIVTTDMVDKRRRLFKTIRETGMTIDCSVPKGDRRADRMAQEAVLNERMRTVLDKTGKTMDESAYTALVEMTGFALRTFSNSLEKLVNYVGDRKEITAEDVQDVLERTKKDPLYDFTNAVTDKNTENALFYMDSLLSGGDVGHPLPLLAAISNQIRKLLILKDFTKTRHGRDWHANVTYANFKRHIMPAVQAFDTATIKQLETWEADISGSGDTDAKREKG